ncbi:hypothetical protein DPEC_G00116090 [Dallia pectoralis]|uniref:Uncharacterized protein n=1 Tax=Dallia pectoralis TaxID=75939 RepID=A0ACC2GUE3_DALPE|nr:hypothetical protein DPEC_G00116090 [Dallia pectoralis]
MELAEIVIQCALQTVRTEENHETYLRSHKDFQIAGLQQTIKTSLDTDIHSDTEAKEVHQPEALSSGVLLGNGVNVAHAPTDFMTSDCDYDLGSVEWLDTAWHTAFEVLEISVSTDADTDLALTATKVSQIPDAVPAVDSTIASKSQAEQHSQQRMGVDQLLMNACADCVTTGELNAVSSVDALNSDEANSVHIENRSLEQVGRDPLSTAEQSMSLLSLTSENAAHHIESVSIKLLTNEALEVNLHPDAEKKPPEESFAIHKLLSFMHLGSTFTCHGDQSLESDSEDDTIEPLGHISHDGHQCASIVRSKVNVQDSPHQRYYETDDTHGYAQDLYMFNYKLNLDQTTPWASLPQYVLTRRERADKEGRKNGEAECDTSSSLSGMHSLIEHTGQWRTVNEVEAGIIPKPYQRDLVMYNGFHQLGYERVENQLILSSLSRTLNDLKEEMAYWKSLGKRDSQLMMKNERLERKMKMKELRDFTSAEERVFTCGKDWRADRRMEGRIGRVPGECEVTKWRSDVESSITGFHPSSPPSPLLKEVVPSKTSFSRTNPKTLSVRQIVRRKSRIAYQMKCVKRWEEASKVAEEFTLTEGGEGPADHGDRETEEEMTGQSKKGASGDGLKGNGEEWAKLGLKEIVGTDDRITKVLRGQKSKDKRRGERERQRCINENRGNATMDMEKRDKVKEDGSLTKHSEEVSSGTCCVETRLGEKNETTKPKEKRNKPPGVAEEAIEDNADKQHPDVRDREEGLRLAGKAEQQKTSDRDGTQNCDGDAKLRHISKGLALDSQALAKYIPDSQAPLRGKGKRLQNSLYQRRQGLQDEKKSKGKAHEVGRPVIVPEGLDFEQTHGGVRKAVGFWSKRGKGRKDTDIGGQEENHSECQTWRDNNVKEPWELGTERGGGKSRSARQRGNQFRIFSKRRRYNWNEPHPSETSDDWRNRQENGVEN